MSEAPQPAADLTMSLPDSWRAELSRHDSPDERIAVIEDSLRCFTYGWLSLLPVLGVAYLYPAVRRFRWARRRKVEWNPARGYLAAGLALASAGWLMALMSWMFVLNALFLAGDLVTQDGDLLNAFPMVLCLGAVPTFIGLLLAWATVWRWLASRPKWLYIAAEIVVVIACGIMWQVLGDGGVRWREQDFELKFWLEVAGWSGWAIWLLGGFVLLSWRQASLRYWTIWLVVLIAVSRLVMRL